MAAISPACVAPSPAAEPFPVEIHPTTTNDDVPMRNDDAAMMLTDEEDSPFVPAAAASADASTASAARIIADESGRGALDALATLAAASAGVSSVSSSSSSSSAHHHHHHHHHHQLPPPQPREITPHHTSSDDDDSEIMPPPPPRSPAAVAPTGPACPAPAVPSFTFLHDDNASYNYDVDTNYNGDFGHAGGGGVAGGGGGRMRSASNPEGMEKWDVYSRRNDRQHFVLPSSILEEELASTRRVLGEVVDEGDCGEHASAGGDDYDYDDAENGGGGVTNQHGGFASRPSQQRTPSQPSRQRAKKKANAATTGFQQHWVRRSKRTIAGRFGTSPDSVSSDLENIEDVPCPPPSVSAPKPPAAAKSKPAVDRDPSSCEGGPSPSSRARKKTSARSATAAVVASSPPPAGISSRSPPPEEDEEEVDESTLEPEELLRRARSRLLEDLSEGSGGAGGGIGSNGEKGGSVLILPHSLSKYKEVYNKNGRIGIYTPAERAAIIHKFNAKRARRVWNKKIRYNCRKNLADRRMRVKGRFVKRSVESGASGGDGGGAGSPPLSVAPEMKEERKRSASFGGVRTGPSRSSSPPTTGSPLPTVNEHDEQPPDEEMPDVEDEEAGFEPSEDMPYRRARRYTIT